MFERETHVRRYRVSQRSQGCRNHIRQSIKVVITRRFCVSIGLDILLTPESKQYVFPVAQPWQRWLWTRGSWRSDTKCQWNRPTTIDFVSWGRFLTWLFHSWYSIWKPNATATICASITKTKRITAEPRTESGWPRARVTRNDFDVGRYVRMRYDIPLATI